MKSIIASSYDIYSRTDWSGIPYYCSAAIRQHASEVIAISPMGPQSLPQTDARQRLARLAHRRYSVNRDLELLGERAQQANQILRSHSDADVVFVFHPPDAAFLDTPAPIVILHDATWRQFTSTYPGFAQETFDVENFAQAIQLERLAFEKAAAIVLFTPWAAISARAEYPDLAHKILHSLPGANFDNVPTNSEVRAMIEARLAQPLRILHIGKESFRKGWDIALLAVKCLNARSLPAILELVGGPIPDSLPYCSGHGFLRKESPESIAALWKLYSDSSIFLFPTRAECAGIVLCEAAAFGLPSFVSGVGGTADMIVDGVTGRIISSNSPEDFATSIASLFGDPDRYRSWCLAAHDRFTATLTWSSTVTRIYSFLGLTRC